MSECVYCKNTFEMTETCSDEFRMWQGLVGPYYIPSVDENGILSWTNTGELPNPDAVDISGPAGASFSIAGIVETVGDLPAEAEGVWLVGDEPPYEGYSFVGGAWEDIGEFAIGPQGPQGDPGATGASAGFGTPTATITNTTGTPSVTVTASGPDTAKVFDFAFTNLKGAKGDTGPAGQGVPTGGTTGQVLAKKSGTNYDTEWVNQSGGGGADPATATPLMDGTAAVGSSVKYAREDHVHPTDTSRQATLVSGTNIKTINNNSLLGSGDITISGDVSSVNGKTGTVVLDLDDIGFATLLWTNASPTSAFSGQTVPLDLSDYDFVIIEAAGNSTNSAVTTRTFPICAVGEVIQPQLILNVSGTSNTPAVIVSRVMTVQSTGIVFGDGYNKSANASSGTSPTTENNRIVPLRIWGIKGVE